LEEITGVVTYAFGFYQILPKTAIKVVKSVEPVVPNPTTLISSGKCDGLTFGQYNVENMYSGSDHIPNVAAHIVDFMKSPDFMFLQEVQDDNGPTNDEGKHNNILQQYSMLTTASRICQSDSVYLDCSDCCCRRPAVLLHRYCS
jgi:hypothetical protein